MEKKDKEGYTGQVKGFLSEQSSVARLSFYVQQTCKHMTSKLH